MKYSTLLLILSSIVGALGWIFAPWDEIWLWNKMWPLWVWPSTLFRIYQDWKQSKR